MELQPGTTFGAYEIVGPLGAGAMGAVYRARDPRLGRSVAIKMISERALLEPRALERFKQEARAASAIAHPNIVTVYEIGQHDAAPFIVMELVEGKSLRELLSRGRLPLKTLLSIAVQIADGLAAAHARNIVHRDVKPENVMVAPDGIVKILDFGIARTTIPAGAPSDSTMTSPLRMTEPGTIVGTASYMSPEQVRGSDVDFRTDQFSFGAVLYEMATGRVGFKRESIPETMVAILREEPLPIRDLSPASPAPLRWIIERCLAKEREGRYDSTQDLARELHSLKDHASEIGAPAIVGLELQAVKPRGPGREWLAAFAVLALVAGVALALAVKWHSPTPLPTFKRLTFRNGFIVNGRFGPDAQTVVFSASFDGESSKLYTTIPGSGETRDLGLPPGHLCAVSRSGEILFTESSPINPWGPYATLYRASLSGGGARALLENVQHADFSPDGKEIAVTRIPMETNLRVERLEYPVGKVLLETKAGIAGLRISPDGSRVAVGIMGAAPGTDDSVVAIDRSGRSETLVAASDGSPSFAWAPMSPNLWLSRWDPAMPSEISEVVPGRRPELRLRSAVALCVLDAAPDGRLLVMTQGLRNEMLVLEANAAVAHDVSWLSTSFGVDISDDGKTVLFEDVRGDGSVGASFVRRTDGSPAIRLGEGRPFSLSRDGKWAVANLARRENELVLYPIGPGQPRTVAMPDIHALDVSFFPDGRSLLVLGRVWGGKPNRFFILPVDRGAPLPVGREGVLAGLLSESGRTLLVRGTDRTHHLLDLDSGAEHAVAGLRIDERLVRFRADGSQVVTSRLEGDSFLVDEVDLTTGRRREIRRLPVPASAVGFRNHGVRTTPDAGTFLYTVHRYSGDLYLVEGLR